MARGLLLILFGIVSCFLHAQFDVSNFKAMKFRNIGPAGMSGRITAIDVDLSNPNRIFVGAASGGVWLSENGGISWSPVFDEQSTLAIGSIKINQKNPSEIWVGTGEGNPRNSLNTGNGIYKSLDGGRTWNKMGLENSKTIHRIIIHRDDSNTVFVAALGSPWGPNADRGVFKTTDGGRTWKKVLYVNDLTGAADMVTDPTNPNKLIVSMWEHKRDPWFFKSGGKGSGLYISYDAGENFKKIEETDGIPKGELGRIGIAVAPGKPNIIYALIEAKENGLYKSVDGGKKWSLVSTKNIGDRPFYYSELYVDPTNENRIFNVYTYLSMSEDGGNSFKEIANYANDVHPDHHAFWIHPTDPSFIIDGNDGGLNISHDGGSNWYFAGNLPVGQFYHVNVDNDFPYNVYGGMQDNGSWVGPSAVLKRGGIRNHDFQELYFGDGFDVVPYRKDSKQNPLQPVTLNVVEAFENNPPENTTPICWCLLTSLPVGNLEEALIVCNYYKLRWQKENFHLTLKEGGRLEYAKLNAKSLPNVIALYSIAAVQVLRLRQLNAKKPDAPVTEAGFETEDFELLEKIVESEKKKTPTTSKLAPTIRNFCILLAQYAHCIIDKKKDVGIRAIWTGLVLFFRLKSTYKAFSSA